MQGLFIGFNVLMGMVILFGNIYMIELNKRMYPNGNAQDLITTCQVDEKIKQVIQIKEEKEYDGCFFDKKGVKRLCYLSNRNIVGANIGESEGYIDVFGKKIGLDIKPQIMIG